MTQISADAQVFLIGLLRKFEQDDGYVDFTEWTATWEALQSRYPEVAHVRDEFRYVVSCFIAVVIWCTTDDSTAIRSGATPA